MDIGEYVYLLPVTYVPQMLLEHIESVLDAFADKIPYPGVDASVDDAREGLAQSLEKLQQINDYFRLMKWVKN